MDDLNIVIDVSSGAIHLFDDCSYEYIARVNEGKSHEEIVNELESHFSGVDFIEVKNEIDTLVSQGTMFSKDDYQELMQGFSNRETVVKALCLHIAHDCNLACKYCFAEEGEYHGDRSMMSFEVGKKAIDYLVKNSGNRKNLEIDFFGGEPLMNFDVVKEVVYYAKSLEEEYKKNFRFTITTNGVLLDEAKMDFINEHMYNVVLSCDGRKEVHDFMRPASNNKGSYDLVMPKFKKMIEKREGKSYYIRGTFTHHNLDFSKDVLHMADEGFDLISVEPVVAPLDTDYAIQPEDIKGLMKEYEVLAEAMLERKKAGKDFTFFHFMIDLSGGPCVAKRLTGCGAGFEYMAVTPFGDLYPCHQFVGMEEFKMGTVDTGVVNLDMQEEFKSCNVFAKDECSKCWAKFYCSGGCQANAYNYNGSIQSVYEMGCELEKKRVECAIYLKAKEIETRD
jgi:uncharacterized protein